LIIKFKVNAMRQFGLMLTLDYMEFFFSGLFETTDQRCFSLYLYIVGLELEQMKFIVFCIILHTKKSKTNV
jgi:hypothetical protein